MTIVRGVLFASVLVAQVGEPLLGDVDLFRYAITQGGLVVVILVMLWFWRRDNQRISQKDDEKIALLTDLVRHNTAALTRAADANLANEKATHRLARAVEHLERRP